MLDGPFELAGIEPLKLVGSGGFGEVWLARQTNIDRHVAVKVGHSPINDETVRIRFERECIALGRLSGHPNIVDVFTAGQLEDGRPYLMLEYVDGGTLWRRLKKSPLSENELRYTGIELADALSVAHGAGILHRDMKPENILLRKSGEAVLGDFGIARLQDGANTTSHPITASVAYAAPEILTGKDATVASDLYGLGVCLLTASIRSVPFMESSDDSVHPIIERVLADDAPDLRTFGYTDGFADLVAGLLSKQGKRRPETAEFVRDQLYRLNEVNPVADNFPLRDEPAQEEAVADVGATTTDRSRLLRNSTSGIRRGRTTSGSIRVAAGPETATPDASPQAPMAAQQATGAASRRWSASRVVLGAVIAASVLVAVLIALILFGVLDDVFDGNNESNGAEAAVAAQPLALPLGSEDFDLGDGATVEADAAGPNSSQFCDNTPTTDGLVDWTGKTNSGAVGYPVVFQQLARFETVQQASTYIDSYFAGVDCQRWTIPGGDQNTPVVVIPNARVNGNPPGEQGIQVSFDGADGLDLSGRVALVRRGSNVYTLSVTSLEAEHVDNFGDWLDDALTTLEF